MSLNEILGFKRNSDSSTGVELIVNLNLTCDRRAELLVGHVARGIRMEDGDEVVVDNGGRQYALQSMEYGTGLDLKEEVFRDFTAIADTVWARDSTRKIYSNIFSKRLIILSEKWFLTEIM